MFESRDPGQAAEVRARSVTGLPPFLPCLPLRAHPDKRSTVLSPSGVCSRTRQCLRVLVDLLGQFRLMGSFLPCHSPLGHIFAGSKTKSLFTDSKASTVLFSPQIFLVMRTVSAVLQLACCERASGPCHTGTLLGFEAWMMASANSSASCPCCVCCFLGFQFCSVGPVSHS